MFHPKHRLAVRKEKALLSDLVEGGEWSTFEGKNGHLAFRNGQFMGYATRSGIAPQLQPLVPPQVLHFMQVPFRTSV